MVKIPNSYDCVLEFESEPARKKFLLKLESFFNNNNNNNNNGNVVRKSVEIIPVSKTVMMSKAETKERRQKRLEHFFREAYALTFGLR